MTVTYLVRAVCAGCLLTEFRTKSKTKFDTKSKIRRWGRWNWRRDETPLGNALVYELIHSATIIAIVWVLAHEQKEPFIELICYTVSPATISSRIILTSARF